MGIHPVIIMFKNKSFITLEMIEDQKKITDERYKAIVEAVPICCVDLIIKSKGKILLVKRKNEPLKGEFWLPGGRIYKNVK